jgi:hypothetical protein
VRCRRVLLGSDLHKRGRGGHSGGLAVERRLLGPYCVQFAGGLHRRGRARVVAVELGLGHAAPVQSERHVQAEPLGHQLGRRHLLVVGADGGTAVRVGRVPAQGATHRQRRVLGGEARFADHGRGGRLAAPYGAGDEVSQDGHCAAFAK